VVVVIGALAVAATAAEIVAAATRLNPSARK
jgi:hypothetical protein